MDPYKRTFKHDDWVDNEDVVQADGDRGFNKKFHDLEDEFDRIAAALTGVTATAATITRTFVPALQPSQGKQPFAVTNGIAEKQTGQSSADGWMQIDLPDGTRIESVTVFGEKNGNVGSFQVQLFVKPLAGEGVSVLTIQLGPETDQFRPTQQVPGTVAPVNTTTNSYLIVARILGADPTARARLYSIQVVCKRA